MAFLTEYSLRQLIEMSEIKDLDKIDLQFFVKNIYDNQYMFYFFNQFDLKKLFREKVILSNDKQYIPTYREVPTRVDDMNYVLEIKGKVKYHYDLQCDALNRGFKNFFMPEPVVKLENEDKEKHKLVVDGVRAWFKINDYTVERYEKEEINDHILTSSFNNTFPSFYNIDPIVVSSSNNGKNQFQWYIAKKSENVYIKKSFDYNVFLETIVDLIKRRDYLCSSRTMQNLSKYDYLHSRGDDEIVNIIQSRISEGYLREVSQVFISNYGLENLKQFWISHRQLKLQAYNEISEYFKWTYNFKEKHFDEIFLENFNLEGCILCKKTKTEDTTETQRVI